MSRPLSPSSGAASRHRSRRAAHGERRHGQGGEAQGAQADPRTARRVSSLGASARRARRRPPCAARRSRRRSPSAPNTAVPATKTLAPARAASADGARARCRRPPRASTGEPARVDPAPELLDLAAARGMNVCPPKPGFTAHHQHLVDVAEHGLDGDRRRRRVQHHAGARARLADLRERAVQVRTGLDVHADRRRRPRARSRAT